MAGEGLCQGSGYEGEVLEEIDVIMWFSPIKMHNSGPIKLSSNKKFRVDLQTWVFGI